MKAELYIGVSKRDECSFLKRSFFTTPFKLANITEDKKANLLHLMLMSSSPGILDGDDYNIKIELEKDCSLQLHTQAYQRLFNMKFGATQQLQVLMEEDSSFCYLAHPSVPHEESIFTGRNDFYLANNCKMIFGEILTCGRKLNAEMFLFSKYQSITNIFINDKLVVKENLLMKPAFINVHAIGQLENYTHQASMIWLQENIDVKGIQLQILDLLGSEKSIMAGVSQTPVNGLIIRLLGYGAEQLYDCLQNIHALLQRLTAKKMITQVDLQLK